MCGLSCAKLLGLDLLLNLADLLWYCFSTLFLLYPEPEPPPKRLLNSPFRTLWDGRRSNDIFCIATGPTERLPLSASLAAGLYCFRGDRTSGAFLLLLLPVLQALELESEGLLTVSPKRRGRFRREVLQDGIPSARRRAERVRARFGRGRTWRGLSGLRSALEGWWQGAIDQALLGFVRSQRHRIPVSDCPEAGRSRRYTARSLSFGVVD